MFGQQYGIFKNKAFTAYFLSCLLAMLGNGLTYIIMIWALMKFNTDVMSTAILMTCFWLPNVILSPIMGVLSDKLSRKKVLLITNGSRAFLLFVFAIYSHYFLSAKGIYFLAVMVGCVLAAYVPAAMTFIREIMPEEEMLYANAFIDIGYEVGAVLGTGCAGLILAFTSISTCFLINGICYLLATLLILYIPYKKNSNGEEKQESFFKQLTKGYSYLTERFTLMLIYFVQALFFICYMTIPVLLAPFAKTVLHANVTQFGMLEAMLSTGVVIGGLLSPLLAERFGTKKVILIWTMVSVIAMYLFSQTKEVRPAYFYHFILGLSFSVWALLITLAQELTDINFQGRVQSLFNSFSGIIIIGFYFILGHWHKLPVRSMYYGEVILLFFAALTMMFLVTSPAERKTALQSI